MWRFGFVPERRRGRHGQTLLLLLLRCEAFAVQLSGTSSMDLQLEPEKAKATTFQIHVLCTIGEVLAMIPL